MIRKAFLLLIVFGSLVVLSPFVISSLLVDQRGVPISGRVRHKDEWVTVHYSSWARHQDISIQYDPPDEPSVAFFDAKVEPERFDQLRQGDRVALRYLRREEIPHLPGAEILRQMHLLVRARLAEQRTWSGLEMSSDARSIMLFKVVAGVLAILIVWRMARVPFFGWAVGLCVLCGIAIAVVHEYPMPTPAPRIGIRHASGTVKSLERVDWLFRDNHQRGFEADQPIQVVGVRFVPEGRSEPVLAVDLIDAGSLPGLKEKSSVDIDYESDAPRVAHISGARRQFPTRNLRGIGFQIVACVVVVVILLVVAGLLGKGYRRLTQASVRSRSLR